MALIVQADTFLDTLSLLPKQAQAGLRRRFEGLKRIDDGKRREKIQKSLNADLEKAIIRATWNESISFPEALPVSERKQEIAEAIRDNQVVIVAGETGSGKTTQIPKICLELGRGIGGMIGHTQPRRLAARSVADRIADELATSLGDVIGFKVRFSDHTQPRTRVKLMTDGILLAEMQNDRLLRQYDTLIIDEAHERSLNIDFLLGYLRQLLPKRPDLKIIITSATIETERFSKHFNNAPVITVSGRTFPVEMRYRPQVEGKQVDPLQGIFDAVDELQREGQGDILIFLNGEREIRDTADALNRRQLRNTEVLPLYARLSAQEQQRIFKSHRGQRIVLATNVAETSLTVPGIRYVIDPGTARISRYSYRTKVQRLPIEAISQASANQRAGRCGRVAAGICIRLYSEEDFLGRAEFTDPEILRTNLAAVILQMIALKLGDIQAFPFMQPPDQKHIRDGIKLLEELGAVVGTQQKLTPLGRQLARIPVDPKLARMVVAANDFGCLDEVLIVASALSIQDPRERPMDAKQASDEKHRRFYDKDSDFSTLVNLWRYIKQQQEELSSSQFRKLCKKEFLSYVRVREWQDLHFQLRQSCRELHLTMNDTEASYDNLHQALLTGLLSSIGMLDKEQEYLGARNRRFYLFPGSALGKQRPKWLMAAELMETSRLFARVAAKIQPQWVEAAAQHLVSRTHSEPHWSKKQGNVLAFEQQTLYGLPIVTKRKVLFGHIDETESRAIFIRSALVERQLGSNLAFYQKNNAVIDVIHKEEEKIRRRDLLVDDDQLYALYDADLPANIYARVTLEKWYRQAVKDNKQVLVYDRETLLQRHEDDLSQLYPDQWRSGNIDLSLKYLFEPGKKIDGVSAEIPVAVLNQVDEHTFAWGVPAHREALLVALIKSLPKPIRRNFVPAPNYAKRVLDEAVPEDESPLEALTRVLRRASGITIPDEAWNWDLVPDHLKLNFRVVNEQGQALAEGEDLDDLKASLQDHVQQTLSDAADDAIEQSGCVTWVFDTLPEEYVQQKRGYEVRAFPAIVDENDSVAVKLFDNKSAADEAMANGVRRLLLMNVPSPIKYLRDGLPNKAKLAMHYNRFGKVQQLVEDCINGAVDSLVADPVTVRSEETFKRLLETVKAELADTTMAVALQVEKVLTLANQLQKQLKGKMSLETVRSQADVKAQLEALVYPGFVADTGVTHLQELPRYLQAVVKRLEKMQVDPQRDRLHQVTLDKVQNAFDLVQQKAQKKPGLRSEMERLRWMLQELRVSLFHQQLGTPYPISEKRVMQAIDEVKRCHQL
ncbi:ATP-dependent RNA helicase HrpA [Corallincola holothuriorum]|uniref:RNA helicase n=1 Tax=Corallincola holothuriorum TaxID=2282215 RepID=A0A368NS48_9GAMM|nr:ATP-dependent RNA helicase HrpA [Corallincola holothuriorum]